MSKKTSVAERLGAMQNRSTLRLTTRGRKTGKPHTVTIWFLVDGATVYLVTMSLRRDWPRNILKNGYAEIDVGGSVFTGRATPIKDAKRLARVKELLNQKYWMAWLGSWLGLGPEGAFAVSLTT
jgi:deazaflavin-dependent oxidoreductase (nitroreductase family)